MYTYLMSIQELEFISLTTEGNLPVEFCQLIYSFQNLSNERNGSNLIKIDDEKKAISILKLLETLDNCEDVQGVYSNFDIEDEIINKINI